MSWRRQTQLALAATQPATLLRSFGATSSGKSLWRRTQIVDLTRHMPVSCRRYGHGVIGTGIGGGKRLTCYGGSGLAYDDGGEVVAKVVAGISAEATKGAALISTTAR